MQHWHRGCTWAAGMQLAAAGVQTLAIGWGKMGYGVNRTECVGRMHPPISETSLSVNQNPNIVAEPQSAPKASANSTPGQRGRVFFLVFLFLLLLTLGWITNAGGMWAKSLAERALLRHDPVAALKWTEWAAWFSPSDVKTNLLGIRAMLQLNMNAAAGQLIDQTSEYATESELSPLRLILASQRGDIQASERLMNWSGPAPLPVEAYEAIVRCSQFNNMLDRAEITLKELEQAGLMPQIVDYQRGRNRELADNLAEAVKSYEIALTKNPSMVRAAFRAGMCYYRLREFNKAEAMFRQAIEDPYQPVAQVELANCLWEQGKLDEAVQVISKCIGFPVDFLQRLYLQVDEFVDSDRAALVAARIADGQNQSERALAMAERVLAHNPREFEARTLQVKCLKLLNRTAEAETAAKIQSQMVANRQRANQLRIELAENPEDTKRLCELAKLYWITESDAEAQLVLKDALRIDPQCKEALELLESIRTSKSSANANRASQSP